MATINFQLTQTQTNRRKKNPIHMIMIRYSHQGRSRLFYSKKSIDIRYWDKGKQMVKRSYPGHSTLNIYLRKFKQKIEDIVNRALIEDINPTVDLVKSTFRRNAPSVGKTQLLFWQFIDQHMENSKVRLNPHTIRSYNNCLNNLKAYERFCKKTICWENIDMQFYHEFMDFYLNYKQLTVNGFGKVIKVLKSFLNEATEQGHNKNRTYKSKSFRVLREEVDNIYLNEGELNILFNLDLSGDSKLEKVRDLFLIGCFTGLRFSDLSTLSSDKIVGNIIRLRTQKTSEEVCLPLLPIPQKIIAKYNGSLPKAYTNQKMNQYLKQIGKEAGLDERIVKYHTSGEGRIETKYAKHELICTHTARRSFATNMHLRGISTLVIMKLTGHKTEQSFMNYIKISKEENVKLFLKQFNHG
ncbi:site-specific integrase [Flagellimonas meridianipacifica]|uniref:Site-specific recombinase XerD n=1 Tax=Flagellimonas meridianipacifica TaxID=1080225 RepID=A0A2T0MFL6_9FLAO|nr:site-specific integrase [Allomuricauda pacifica]PRX56370.1 site-specific recombinase XerD [Allomuricauda pacifica]